MRPPINARRQQHAEIRGRNHPVVLNHDQCRTGHEHGARTNDLRKLARRRLRDGTYPGTAQVSAGRPPGINPQIM